ncbi:MAG: hypothetical protein ACI9BD_001536 [Candidatus Marinamargulisbacteria bacterium]|jgi:hypothetical protein
MTRRQSIYVLFLALLFPFNIIAADSDLNLKGDVRLRVQNQTTASSLGRARQRIRLRLQGKKQISENSLVGFGIASGGSDPRSTNQTLENSFDSPDLRLDQAYIRYTMTSDMTLVGGKMKNPLWRPSDLLWDTDITPEGFALKTDASLTDLNIWLNAGYFILDETSASESDPFLLVAQAGSSIVVSEEIASKLALSVYSFQNTSGQVMAHSAGTNSGATTGLLNETSAVVGSTELTFKDVFAIPMFKTFAEIVVNMDASSANKGGIFGIKFGDKKPAKLGQWQATVAYRYLGKDAWMDMLPDSDSYSGATDIQGLELIYKLALSKKTAIAIDIYQMDRINGAKNSERIIQLDFSGKF